jgi:hypothetical protein
MPGDIPTGETLENAIRILERGHATSAHRSRSAVMATGKPAS